jgi:glycolate oxidase iron-sulfur subunit
MLGVPAILRVVSKFLSLVQRSGFITFISRRSVVRKLFPMVVEMTKLLPDFSGKNSTEMLQNRSPVQKGQRFKVAFLTGCLMDTAFAEVNVDTVELLEKLGCEVIIPPKQYCCGSLHAHYGENQKARKLAQKNVEIFDTFEYDFLVANSAGCGAYMKEYGHLFAEVPGLAEKAQKFSSKVLDLFEFLLLPQIELRFREWKSSLTYHDACHLCHTQKMFNEPRKVLAKIPGLDYRSLPDSTRCCGSAGIYNIMRYPDSMQFLEKKMMNIANTGAENVLTANPGCFLQIKYGAEKFNRNIKVLHPASLLNSILEQAQNKIG